MKPLKLTMSAFGSYVKETAIDFERLGDGIFLITGDTGAGKTTIFDAIAFALYGETSGQRREGPMMRSQWAPPDQETRVELVFSDGGETYKIVRSPSYQRRSLRKNGSTTLTSQWPVSAPAEQWQRLLLKGGAPPLSALRHTIRWAAPRWIPRVEQLALTPWKLPRRTCPTASLSSFRLLWIALAKPLTSWKSTMPSLDLVQAA